MKNNVYHISFIFTWQPDWPSPKLIQEIINGGVYLVAKAVSSYDTANGSSGVWSFTEAERKIFRWPANVSSCGSKVLRSLKDIVKAKNLHPLKSHHMKKILFYECEAKPHPILLGFCQWSITDWLTFWRGQLNNGVFPNYFMTGINLFESFSPQEKLSWLAAEV